MTTEVKKRRPKTGPKVNGGSREARQSAAVILDVLSGLRTPTQAASVMSVSLQRYYAIESRALEGLVEACEPRPKGRRQTPQREAEKLRKDVARLQRECDRKQALVRASQRAIGLSAPPTPARIKGKRVRRPVIRALKAAEVLRSAPELGAPEGVEGRQST